MTNGQNPLALYPSHHQPAQHEHLDDSRQPQEPKTDQRKAVAGLDSSPVAADPDHKRAHLGPESALLAGTDHRIGLHVRSYWSWLSKSRPPPDPKRTTPPTGPAQHPLQLQQQQQHPQQQQHADADCDPRHPTTSTTSPVAIIPSRDFDLNHRRPLSRRRSGEEGRVVTISNPASHLQRWTAWIHSFYSANSSSNSHSSNFSSSPQHGDDHDNDRHDHHDLNPSRGYDYVYGYGYDHDSNSDSLITVRRSLSPSERRWHLISDTSPRPSDATTMFTLIALAKFAAFTDVFLSGLVIPLIPHIINERTQVPADQVQMWTSILIAAYGGAFVAASPFIPFLTRQGPSRWAVLFFGIVSAAASFALLHLASNLRLLVLARALQGFAAVATTGACSGMSAAAGASAQTTLAWLSPAIIQSTAMAAGPVVAGFLHDYADGQDAVFYCAYALIASNALLGLVALIFAPKAEVDSGSGADQLLSSEGAAPNYGTISSDRFQAEVALRGGRMVETVSARSSPSPSLSPTRSRRSSVTSTVGATHEEHNHSSQRLIVAMCGYLVVGLLTTALQSVLPLFVEHNFGWSMSNIGFAFVALSGPAALISPIADAFTDRVSKGTRLLAAFGFLVCVPAFVYLGRFTGSAAPTQIALLTMLVVISFGMGLCADPLVKEITRAVTGADRYSPAIGNTMSAVAQASSLPNVAYAWGSLIGPLLVGAVSWVWDWDTMARSLGVLSAITGVAMFLFLQGWVGNVQSQNDGRTVASAFDEESAPFLTGEGAYANRVPSVFYDEYEQPENLVKGGYYERAAPMIATDESGSIGTKISSGHRRHFSVDNIPIVGLQPDQEASQVRFQASLESPLPLFAGAATLRHDGDAASKHSSKHSERRFLMREAPHAPATDPLLAAGNRYVLDEDREDGEGRGKRHVVVFEEGEVSPELLRRRQHHIVTINSLDGSAKLAASNPKSDHHAMHVTEETEGEEPEFSGESRRYVVVLLNEGETGLEGGEQLE
ncbi:major facilitator superfamily domain-containing protein [Cercophora scortea]|uniref:Major facilitator superfamily domain-containing protein n=1 Tax=Cercophora scortea TaxID=314031 RepID=A0AAE0J3M2_9PEZI|nr:major facilitator superfamily domain-containing protein [Cercophora scortea]